jgi:hypothetical protein
MIRALEDNGGGLYVVDDEARIIGWGAEQCLADIDATTDIVACLDSDLTDWSNYATDGGNSLGDTSPDDGHVLTYEDYADSLTRPEIKTIAEVIDGQTHLYPESMGNNGKKWARITTDPSAAAAILGHMTSPAKAAASRENGKKGGRPKKPTA